MKLDVATKDVETAVKDLVMALTNRLTAGDNFQARVVSVAAPAVADTEFTVVHGLGVKPTFYVANADRSAVVYDSRRASWTTTELYLKCTVPSAALTLLVM